MRLGVLTAHNHGRTGMVSVAPRAAQSQRARFPNLLVRRCSMQDTSECLKASFSHCLALGCTPFVQAWVQRFWL
jgi:hypothetical protein